MALEDNFFRLVPVSILLRRRQIRSMISVQILENTILILQPTKMCSLRRRCILDCGKPSALVRCRNRGRKSGGGARCRRKDTGRQGGDNLR